MDFFKRYHLLYHFLFLIIIFITLIFFFINIFSLNPNTSMMDLVKHIFSEVEPKFTLVNLIGKGDSIIDLIHALDYDQNFSTSIIRFFLYITWLIPLLCLLTTIFIYHNKDKVKITLLLLLSIVINIYINLFIIIAIYINFETIKLNFDTGFYSLILMILLIPIIIKKLFKNIELTTIFLFNIPGLGLLITGFYTRKYWYFLGYLLLLLVFVIDIYGIYLFLLLSVGYNINLYSRWLLNSKSN